MDTGINFRIHQVSYSEVDANGFIGIQFDAFGEEKSGMPAVEAHHPFGFMSRPSDPDVDPDGSPKFGCNVLVGWDGEEAHAWPLSDPRSRLVLPVLLRGESIQYGAAGNFVRCHLDGRVSLFTTDDGTPNGKTVALQVKPDGFLFSAPWGKIVFDATGFHVLHSSGAAFDLGAIGGLPAPLDVVSSYAKLTAGMIQNEASIIASGSTTGAPEPLTKATSLLIVLGTISSALADVQLALAALVGAGTGPTAPAAITASAAAITAAAGAITAGAATLNAAAASA